MSHRICATPTPALRDGHVQDAKTARTPAGSMGQRSGPMISATSSVACVPLPAISGENRSHQAAHRQNESAEYDHRSSGTASLAYDAAGSLTSDGDKLYEYDALGRLTYAAGNANTNVELARYAYDALGRLAMQITYDYRQDASDPYDQLNTTRYFYYDTPDVPAASTGATSASPAGVAANNTMATTGPGAPQPASASDRSRLGATLSQS